MLSGAAGGDARIKAHPCTSATSARDRMTGDEELELPCPPPRSPEARLRAYGSGQAGAPKWDVGEPIDGPETTLIFAEEEVVHPEDRPLLSLCNMDGHGTVLGEVWFAPADIPAIIAFLQGQLTHNYRSEQRRWRGNDAGPALYFGEVGEAADVVDKDEPCGDGTCD